jgi:hypothetical protein
VNANPSGSRTPSTGSWGRSQARRELAAATEPSPGYVPIVGVAGIAGAPYRLVRGMNVGTRHAMTVCRGALNLRCAAQGRVGDLDDLPRHVVRHLAPHLLLLANSSAPADAVRPLMLVGARFWPSDGSTVPTHASRPRAQPGECFAPRHGARDTELVQAGCDVVETLARGHSRGKGVLAA